MKTKHITLAFFLLILIASCSQLRQMANLRKCQFRIQSITGTRLAGVDIQRIQGFSDLKFADAAKATSAFLLGNLPLEFNLGLQVRNPNTETAAMNKFDWIAMIDQTEILEGTSSQRVEVTSNGGLALIPLRIRVNLKQILNRFTKKQVMDFGMGLADSQNKPVRVALKLKPSIMVGQRAIAYPGWFTIKREFTAGN